MSISHDHLIFATTLKICDDNIFLQYYILNYVLLVIFRNVSYTLLVRHTCMAMSTFAHLYYYCNLNVKIKLNSHILYTYAEIKKIYNVYHI